MSKLKSTIIKLFTLLFVACSAFAIATMPKVSAQEVSNFSIEQSASIINVEGDDPVGLCFNVTVNEAWFEEYEGDKYTFGTLIYPTANDGLFSQDKTLADNMSALDAAHIIHVQDKAVSGAQNFEATLLYDLQVVIDTIESKGLEATDELIDEVMLNLYMKDFSARAYAIVDGEVVYTNAYSTSVVEIANSEEMGEEVTKLQWESAFDFENVTIDEYYALEGEDLTYQCSILMDGDKGVMTDGNMSIPIAGEQLLSMRMMFDFSSCYESAVFEDGCYVVSEYDISGDGSMVYKNACLTFNNGLLTSIYATVEDSYPEIDESTGDVVGVITDTTILYVEFRDYGTTVAEVPKIPEEEINALNAENFTNFTFNLTLSTEEGESATSISQLHLIDNNQEKVTVSSVNDVELYFVNGRWYAYVVSLGEYSVANMGEFSVISFEDLLVYEFEYVRVMLAYGMMQYNEEMGEYYYIDTGEESGVSSYISIKIENGKLVSYCSQNQWVDGDITHSSRMMINFFNYGSTSFNVPFTPSGAPEDPNSAQVDWESVFALENVTVNHYVSMGGTLYFTLASVYKLDGNDAYVQSDSYTSSMPGAGDQLRAMFDLSKFLVNASKVGDGLYYIPKIDYAGDGSVVYTDVYVTIDASGLLLEMKLNTVQSGFEMAYRYEFVDYGSTSIE